MTCVKHQGSMSSGCNECIAAALFDNDREALTILDREIAQAKSDEREARKRIDHFTERKASILQSMRQRGVAP